MTRMSTIVARIRERAALNMAFVGITGGLCCLGWLGHRHLQDRLTEVGQQTLERESMLTRHEKLRETSLEIQAQLGAVKEVLETLQAKVPPIPEESQFLHALSKRASEAGVSLSEFRPGGVTKRPDCKEIELRLRGTGPYASICRWLDSLGNVPRFVRIANVAFTGPSTAGGDCIVDIELDLLFGLSTQPQLASTVKP